MKYVSDGKSNDDQIPCEFLTYPAVIMSLLGVLTYSSVSLQVNILQSLQPCSRASDVHNIIQSKCSAKPINNFNRAILNVKILDLCKLQCVKRHHTTDNCGVSTKDYRSFQVACLYSG